MKNIPACPHFRGALCSTLPERPSEIQKPTPAVRQGTKPPLLRIPEDALDEILREKEEWKNQEEDKK
jgi:hypothetical protein